MSLFILFSFMPLAYFFSIFALSIFLASCTSSPSNASFGTIKKERLLKYK